MKSKKAVSVRQFINEYLIGHIGTIKDQQPYFAFVLMAIGIEFLGKCLNKYSNWNYYSKGQPARDFKRGMQLTPLKRYIKLDLYHKLRCGLAHSLLTDGGLTLSDESGVNAISCKQFFQDFEAACKEVLAMKNLPKKDLDLPFFTVTNTVNADGKIVSVTGHTTTVK